VSPEERLRQLDLWTFQRKEIESVQPRAQEDEQLEAERKILQNMTRLQENSAAAYALLYDSPESATTQLRLALKRLDELTRIDESLAEGQNSTRDTRPPYEIEWNQFEKARMQADDDLRKNNFMYTKVLNRDTGILLGYEIASRMSGK